MNITILIFSIVVSICFGQDAWGRYWLSSETKVCKEQGSLEKDQAFVFFSFLLTGEEEPHQISRFIQQELKRVGVVIEHHITTDKGADLECFSNPSLQFTLEQLVDQGGHLLPVIKATLEASSVVEIKRNNDLIALPTNSWTVYLEINKNVEKLVKKTFPPLLAKFIAAYEKANGKDAKPTFYIVAD